MKKTFNILLLFMVLYGTFSCKNDLEPMDAGNHRNQRMKSKPMVKTVRMSFGGDYITESEEELVRAEEPDTYTAINVFRTNLNEAEAKQERYAYGLFTSKGPKGSVEIKLVTGYKYDFEASILIDDVDKFKVYEGYAEPFYTACDKDGINGLGNYSDSNKNKFVYTYDEISSFGDKKQDEEREYFWLLKYGYAYVDTQEDPEYSLGVYRNPKVKRYYGSKSFTLTDSKSPSNIELEMGFKCFGLQIQVAGLPGGSLTVKDVTDHSKDSGVKRDILKKEAQEHLILDKNLVLSETGINSWKRVYSMNNLLDESEEFDLEFNWNKGNGEFAIIPCHIVVKPGVLKKLSVNLDGVVNENLPGNIKFTMGDSNLIDDDIQEVTNKDSELSN